jgi:hypothetical protein
MAWLYAMLARELGLPAPPWKPPSKGAAEVCRRGRPRGRAGAAGAAGAGERWARFLARALPPRAVADFADFRRLQPRVARSVLLGFELSGHFLVGWSCSSDTEDEAGLLGARQLAESAGFVMSDPTVLRFELYRLAGLVQGGPVHPRLAFDCVLPLPTMAWLPIAAPGVPFGLQVTVTQTADEEAFVVCALAAGTAVELFKPPPPEGGSWDDDDDYKRTRGTMLVGVVPARLARGRPGLAAAGGLPRLPRRAFCFEVDSHNSGGNAAVTELRIGKCPRSGLHAVTTQREDFAVLVTWFAVDLAPCAPGDGDGDGQKRSNEAECAAAALDAAAGRPFFVEREALRARVELLPRCRWPWWSEERLSHLVVDSPPAPGGDQNAHTPVLAGQRLEARVVCNSHLDVEVLLRRCLSYDLALPIKGAPAPGAHRCAAPELCAVARQVAAGAGAAPEHPCKRVKAAPDVPLAIDDFDFRLDRLTPCARWLDLHAVVRLTRWRPREEREQQQEDTTEVGVGGDDNAATAAAAAGKPAPAPADGLDIGLTLRVDCHSGSYVVRDKARMALGRAAPPPLKARLDRYVERALGAAPHLAGRGDADEGLIRTWQWDHVDPASERPLLELRNPAFPVVIRNSAAVAVEGLPVF